MRGAINNNENLFLLSGERNQYGCARHEYVQIQVSPVGTSYFFTPPECWEGGTPVRLHTPTGCARRPPSQDEQQVPQLAQAVVFTCLPITLPCCFSFLCAVSLSFVHIGLGGFATDNFPHASSFSSVPLFIYIWARSDALMLIYIYRYTRLKQTKSV